MNLRIAYLVLVLCCLLHQELYRSSHSIFSSMSGMHRAHYIGFLLLEKTYVARSAVQSCQSSNLGLSHVQVLTDSIFIASGGLGWLRKIVVTN